MINNDSKYILLILIFFLSSLKLEAHENSLDHYFLNKDVTSNSLSKSYLSSNMVTSIAQDAMGVMWFGTKQGLNSFDSYDFFEYNQNNGIINATITDIQPVGDTLFIGTVQGLSIYDLRKRVCTNYFYENDSLILPDNNITFISKPINGKVVICTKNGTTVYDLKNKTFTRSKILNYTPKYEVNAIEYIEATDSWWVATSDGLVNYKSENQSINHYYHIKDMDNTLPSNILNCICTIDPENVFIGTANGLCKLNTIDRSITRINLNKLLKYQPSKMDISKIIVFNDNEIMISTRGDGIFIYDYQKNTAKQISKFNRYFPISENYVLDIFKDNNEAVWIATSTGVNKLEKKLANFNTIQHFEDRSILAITYFLEMRNSNVLVGTESGIKIFDIEDASMTDFNKYYDIKNDIFDSLYIYSFYYDSIDDNLWVGTRNNGLFIYNFGDNEIINVADDFNINKLRNAIVREMFRDKFNNIWAGTNIGLGRIKLSDKNAEFYIYNKNDKTSIPNNDIYDLMMSDSLLYVTTGDGLAVYSYLNDNFTTYRIPDSLTKDNVVKNNGLYDIVDGKNGRYYIGSYSCGLVTFFHETNRIKITKSKGSFSSSMVYSIIPDKNGILWASTNKGITRYDMQTKETTIYDVNDGLPGNEFTPNAFLYHSAGYIFFGGFNGFTYFKPEEIKLETAEPQLLVTSLRTNNDKCFRYIQQGDTIHLSSKDYSFEIEFATLNMMRKNMITYSYFLEDCDKEWSVYNSSHRYADYHQMRPGTYKFKLKAANEVNVWTETPFEFTIIIHPAWYQRLLVKVLLLIAILFTIFMFIRQRTKMLIQKREHRKKIDELEIQMNQLKQKTLQLQMNPHVIFNTLNSIQQYIINHDVDNAVRYLSSFSRLMRRILNNSNERYIQLSDELDAIRLYLELESMRLGNKFSYRIDVDDNIDEKEVEVSPLVIQPFVENAIIHGLVPKKNDCHLEIKLRKIDTNKLLCVIEDNGVGRKQSEEMKIERGTSHKSYGMSITRRRLEMLSKISNEDFSVEITDLYDDNNVAIGTRVNIIISVQE